MEEQILKVAQASAKLWKAFETMTEAMEILGTDPDMFPLVEDIAENRRYVFRAYDSAENLLAVFKSLERFNNGGK